MNDHIHAAEFMQPSSCGPVHIGYQLNETPMSALGGPDGLRYGDRQDAFRILWLGWAMNDIEGDDREWSVVVWEIGPTWLHR
ncbi:hypothetical protein N9N28_08995 [Rubripirellula amarantea]|nr:hypothetical protein [Rubripirellula amarantea]